MTRQTVLTAAVLLALAAAPDAARAASENYPVVYPGGTPPATVVGALDADDDFMSERPASCTGLVPPDAGAYAFDTVSFSNSGASVANVVFTTADSNGLCTSAADTVVIVYAGSFNPAAPLVNCESVNDDTAAAANACSQITLSVPAGGSKTIVVTSHFPGLFPIGGPAAPSGTSGLFGWQGGFGGTTPVSLQSFSVDQAP